MAGKKSKTLSALYREINQKLETPGAESGTLRLIKEGPPAVLIKLVEESAEIWMASRFESKEALALEISQYWYYLVVLGMLTKHQEWGIVLTEIEKGSVSDENQGKVTPKLLVQETAKLVIRYPNLSLADLKTLFEYTFTILRRAGMSIEKVNTYL